MESENLPGNSSSIGQCDVILLSKSGATIAVALLYGILIPPIVVGNGLVVISFLINHKLRTATNIFICGLGLSDLLIGLFSVPYWIYISSLEVLMKAYCNPTLYKVYICLDIWTGCASILQLTAIAIERLYFTVAPLRHRRLPRTLYWYMIGIAWFYSTFMAVLQPLQTNWVKEYSLLLMITCFIFPLFIMLAVYLYILKVGRRQAKKKPSTRKRMGSTGGDFKEFNIFITVIVITGVFIIAWAPFFVVTVVASLCHSCITHPEHDPLVRVVKWMQYSSSAINPYIYAYRNKEVRLTFKKILHFVCFCGCCSPTRLDKERKMSTRNVQLNSVAKTNVDNLGNRAEKIRSQNRQHRQHHPRIVDIDELIGHDTSSSGTIAPQDSRDGEWSFTKHNLNARSSVNRVHDPANKDDVFFENNGYVGMKASTRSKQQKTGNINRSVKQKGIDNEAFHLQELPVKKELKIEKRTKNHGSRNEGNKRQSHESRKSRYSTNQNKTNKPRDSSIAHLSHSDVTLEVPANQKRFRRSHDMEMARNVNKTSHKATNQLRRHRPRDKDQTMDHIGTCNEGVSHDASYV